MARLIRFLFPAEPDRWLSVLRVGLGLQVIFYTFSSRGDWDALFAKSAPGLVTRELTEGFVSLASPLVPRLGWLVSFGHAIGLGEGTVLWGVWIGLLCAGCFMLVGLCCRSASAIAWFLHLSAVKSEELLSYGMDNFTTIGLFYLMVSPLPDRLALDHHIWPARSVDPQLSGFFRRVLQVHVCAIYFFGGVMKCLGPEWWNGTSIWRALTSPPYNLISPHFLISWKYALPVASIAICLLETGYPVFIWLKKTRLSWLICICAMHAGIGVAMGLYLFSFIMIVLNLAAFGPDFSFGWKWIDAGKSKLRGQKLLYLGPQKCNLKQ